MAGIVHKSRGRPSNNRGKGELREQVITLYKQKYGDFGPTLAAEMMRERDGLVVVPETLRRWLITEGLRTAKKRTQKHRERREPKAQTGEMVQVDGSEHRWP